LLKEQNQSHIPAFWGQLDESQSKNLLVQIHGLDFATIEACSANFVKKSHIQAGRKNVLNPLS
jgi:hypothetical protein